MTFNTNEEAKLIVVTITGTGNIDMKDVNEYLRSLNLPSDRKFYLVFTEGITRLSNSLGPMDFAENICDIKLPDSLLTIDSYAIVGYSLTSITIPKNVIKISKKAFFACKKLENIYVDEANLFFSDINGVLFSKDKTKLLAYPRHKRELLYIVPKGVESLEPYAFHYAEVKNIRIPSSVRSISSYAFFYCDILVNLDVSMGNKHYLTYDGILYKDDMSTLVYYPIGNKNPSFIVPRWVFKISSNAFMGSRYLKDIIFPTNIWVIGEKAFKDCVALRRVILPNDLRTLGDYAFSGCSSLLSINIPKYINYIGKHAFYKCYKLIEVCNLSRLNLTLGAKDNGHVSYYAKNISTSLEDSKINVTSDGFITYANEEINGYYLLAYDGNLRNITLPDNIDGHHYKIYRYAFCSYDEEDIEELKNEILINPYGTYETGLESITISSGVTDILDHAFAKCSFLKDITIPNTVKTIGFNAFYWCLSIRNIYISDLSAWLNIDFKNQYSNPAATPSIVLLKNDYVRLYLKGEVVNDLIIPDDITILKDYVFCGFDFESVVIPKSVKTIGTEAFSANSNIDSVFYLGSKEEFKNILIKEGNEGLLNAKIYYYSKKRPKGDGNYFHYDKHNNIKIWKGRKKWWRRY